MLLCPLLCCLSLTLTLSYRRLCNGSGCSYECNLYLMTHFLAEHGLLHHRAELWLIAVHATLANSSIILSSYHASIRSEYSTSDALRLACCDVL